MTGFIRTQHFILQCTLVHVLKYLFATVVSKAPKRQIAYGIDEIIQKCGADIHTTEDWETIFLLLKTAGAGLILEKTVNENEEQQRPESLSASETDLSQSGVSGTGFFITCFVFSYLVF